MSYHDLCPNAADSAVALHSSSFIHRLPPDCILHVITLAIHPRLTSILNYAHVCASWRNVITGDHILCAKVAFVCRTTEAAITFLRWAGTTCQSLNFDSIIGRNATRLEDRMRIIRFIFQEPSRLQNATHIISCISFCEARWFSRLRSLTSFPHLETLNVHLDAIGILPEIEAPIITTLVLTATRHSVMHVEGFVSFFKRLPSLRSIALQNISCGDTWKPAMLDCPGLSIHLPQLKKLNLTGILSTEYPIMHRLLARRASDIETSFSLTSPLPLRELWSSLSIRNTQRLHVSLLPFHAGFEIIIQDPDITYDSNNIETGSHLCAGPHYVAIIYYLADFEGSDFIHDAQLYAQQTDTVLLRLAPSSMGVTIPLSDSVATERIIPWLQSMSNPRHLIIDSILQPVIERGTEFIWSSLQQIEIICRAHYNTSEDDDQATVNTVRKWLQQPMLGHAVNIKLVGQKWQPDSLSVAKLRGVCRSWVDART